MPWLSRFGLVLGCGVWGVLSRGDPAPAGWCDTHAAAQRLSATWLGTGHLFGREAVSRLSWSCALGGSFLRLSFRNGFAGQGNAVIEAEAYYAQPLGDRLGGSWFDSRGMTLSLSAVIGDSVLRTSWTGGGERGRTEYRLTESGTLRVIDEVGTGDGWREFGRTTYRRE